MKKKTVIDFQTIRDNRDADHDKYRLAQAQRMIFLFTIARGRAPENPEELAEFLVQEHAAGRIPSRPLDPYA